MPMLPKKPCAFPGCKEIVPSKQRYCKVHSKKVKQDYEKTRETAVKRGYTRRWQRLRGIVLAQEPMCGCLDCKNTALVANLVHHIDGNAKNNSLENLLSMNDDCHNRLHAAQGERFGKRNN
jgi:5-methylcytosine-specific restriction protein A